MQQPLFFFLLVLPILNFDVLLQSRSRVNLSPNLVARIVCMYCTTGTGKVPQLSCDNISILLLPLSACRQHTTAQYSVRGFR
ncbi:hypothetical protein B0T26DRAFT_164608 [Lasiosphaeria miniovina]|uniref:Secreted protein n=1 Tax=Lasiosphaeria miniovina TaxID=1954250 RepID=A0AA40B5V6_9PEZI|nr:uncharacterized protein B0T26DRAFT_164608 [Lasiosphaeria miniovina]KAK0728232.1 hypothetical protein B0T26DRAFT_164608 [Lasiosphaeria miniovina]